MKQTLEEQLHKDIELMDALKVDSISHELCNTNRGALKLNLRKGSRHYELLLDQTPISPEQMTFVLPHIEHLI